MYKRTVSCPVCLPKSKQPNLPRLTLTKPQTDPLLHSPDPVLCPPLNSPEGKYVKLEPFNFYHIKSARALPPRSPGLHPIQVGCQPPLYLCSNTSASAFFETPPKQHVLRIDCQETPTEPLNHPSQTLLHTPMSNVAPLIPQVLSYLQAQVPGTEQSHFEFIKDQIKNPNLICVFNCTQGMERSPAFMLAFLIRLLNIKDPLSPEFSTLIFDLATAGIGNSHRVLDLSHFDTLEAQQLQIGRANFLIMLCLPQGTPPLEGVSLLRFDAIRQIRFEQPAIASQLNLNQFL